MSKKVLEIITPSKIGGAEVFVSNFSRYLKDKDLLAGVFCPSERPFLGYVRNNRIAPVSWKTYGKFDFQTIFRFKKIIKSLDAGVVHTHLSTASLLGAFAANIAGVRSVAHVHGFNSAACFRYSDKIIAVSEAVKNHLVMQNISKDKIEVLYNGIDCEHFSPVDSVKSREKLELPRDILIIGVFGRLSAEKGQAYAIKLMSEICKINPEAMLLVVGSGKDEANLKALANDILPKNCAVFAGFQNDIRAYMAACDMVVIPSIKEGFGLAAVEAMAMRKVVFASKTGGLLEIIEDEKSGYLIDFKNELKSVADKILNILSDKQNCIKIGFQARERVLKYFNFNIQAQKLYNILADKDE